jgi:hypothetical protein
MTTHILSSPSQACGALAVAVATPTPLAPHAPAESVNIGGAPAAASLAAQTIPPPPAFVAAVTITRTPLATTMSVATQTALDLLVKGNIGSDEAGSR